MNKFPSYPSSCERWDLFEITLSGPDDSTSFDRNITGYFTGGGEDPLP